jgi:hypothetical protein
VVSVSPVPLTLSLLVVALALGTAPGLYSDGLRSADSGDQAIVLVEMRVLEGPKGGGQALATVHCGDMVTVLGPRENGRVRVETNGTPGWVILAGVVELSEAGADARLLAAAHEKEMPNHWSREPDHLAALALYSRHIELLPNSPYAALALHRFGKVADRLAVDFTREVNEAVDAAAQRDRPPVVELAKYRHLEESASRKCQTWGLTFEYSHLGGHYFYGGDVYRKILERHGDSEWADDAAFGLLRLVRELVGEWEAHPQEPLKELDLWAEFMRTYPGSELKPEAMLEMVYLNRALHEIYSRSTEGFADSHKAEQHLAAARTLCGTTRRDFPRTIFAARAERHLAELAQGGHVYLFGAGID